MALYSVDNKGVRGPVQGVQQRGPMERGNDDMRAKNAPNVPFLYALIKRWGIEKLEFVTRYPRTAIYQWKPSRAGIPPEAALRIAELAQPFGFYVETMCPQLNWALVYGGRERRVSYDGVFDEGPVDVKAVVKCIGVTEIARTVKRSRMTIYTAMEAEKCPVWLALAIEEASGQLYLVEDFRPELPWYPLYNRLAQPGAAMPFDRSEAEAIRRTVKNSKQSL